MKYFVEAHTKQGVEHVSMLLADLAIIENWMSNQEDTLGGKHKVCEIPDLKTMKLIYSMDKADKRVRIDYWKREETGGARLESADFLVRDKPVIRRQAGFRRSMERLAEINAAKAVKDSK